MLICTLQNYPNIFVSLFNNILEKGGSIPLWSLSAIVPIFKNGPQDDPNNYRGISLLSSLGKLFYSVLNNRLLNYCREKAILSPSQLGFLPGNRTTDAHLILYNLICKYCHRNNMKIYGCFVDFSKAFDSLPRDILFKKLISYGISGRFFNALKSLYSNDKSCIKIEGKISNAFLINQGVRQGCPLSPLLFNIFLADLSIKLDGENKVSLDNNHDINCLLWADDLLLLSDTEDGLNKILQQLYTYCNENFLTINIDKTKCMIFNKTGKLIRRNFHLGNVKLENVRSYILRPGIHTNWGN